MFWTLALTAIVLIAARYLLQWLTHWRGFPGLSHLSSLPLIGHAPFFAREGLVPFLMRLSKEEGPVVRVDVGNRPTIWICDIDCATEAYNTDVFNSKPFATVPSIAKTYGFDSKGNVAGVFASTGIAWKEQRRFMQLNLSNLGMGKKDTMEDIISQETDDVIEHLSEKMQLNNKVLIERTFTPAIINVIWRILTGKRTTQADPQLKHLASCLAKVFEANDPTDILRTIESSGFCVYYLYRLFGIKTSTEFNQPLKDLILQEIGNSEEDSDGYFVGRYLAQMRKSEGSLNSFTGQDGHLHLFGSLYDVFLAGTESSSTMVEWTLLYLMKYPMVQEKMFAQIEQVAGSRSVCLKDRDDLSWVTATIEEVARHCPANQLNAPHMVACDTVFKGLHIPKDTQVFVFNGAINFSETLYDQPQEFNPERFIDKDTGHFKHASKKVAGRAFFGFGPRKCPGEVFARAEAFLFVSRIVQGFKLCPVVTAEDLDLSGGMGSPVRPKPYYIAFKPRK